MPTVAEIAAKLECIAPLAGASDWDNIGLLVGDPSAQVERVLTCLTATPAVAAEAIEQRVNLIVAHHPVLFRPIQRLTTASAESRMLLDLIRAGIAIFSAHTAYDNAAGGINDQIAERIGLTAVRSLRVRAGADSCKLVVFVPPNDFEKVSAAVFAAGAGRIGNYRECSFRVSGTGTFFGEDAAQPAVGRKGRREELSELRLEAVCPKSAVGAVIAAMRAAHSYEEPAFDIYPLQSTAGQGGEGRIGELGGGATLGALADSVRSQLGVAHLQIIGDPARNVRRVAIVCGSGGEFLDDAVRSGADVFLTGEMRFHGCVEAESRGIGVIVAGHYATERFAMETLAVRLQQQFTDCQVRASERESDPASWV
jgi:dinuclear metal center YbgI/SA1388 family protein